MLRLSALMLLHSGHSHFLSWFSSTISYITQCRTFDAASSSSFATTSTLTKALYPLSLTTQAAQLSFVYHLLHDASWMSEPRFERTPGLEKETAQGVFLNSCRLYCCDQVCPCCTYELTDLRVETTCCNNWSVMCNHWAMQADLITQSQSRPCIATISEEHQKGLFRESSISKLHVLVLHA